MTYAATNKPWTEKDEVILLAGLSDDLSVFDLAAKLDREPVAIVQALPFLGLFEFAPYSEEEAEIMALALAGAPLGASLQWCLGMEERALRSEILGARVDYMPAMEVRRFHRIAVFSADMIEDLRWLGQHASERIEDAAQQLSEAFEIASPSLLRQAIEGRQFEAVQPRFIKNVERGLPTSLPAPTPRGKTSKSQSRRSGRGGKRWYAKRRSPSVPVGEPARDTRSAADKAWETRTHW